MAPSFPTLFFEDNANVYFGPENFSTYTNMNVNCKLLEKGRRWYRSIIVLIFFPLLNDVENTVLMRKKIFTKPYFAATFFYTFQALLTFLAFPYFSYE